MRIRMMRAERGEIDGVALDSLLPGLVYDVAPSLATYLITSGSAAPLSSEEPALIVPLEQRIAASEKRFREVAADWSKSRRSGEPPAVDGDEPEKDE